MKRALIIFFSVFLLHGQWISADMPDPDELGKLLDGKVLVLDSRSEKPGGTVRVRALAQVPAEEVWNVIVSCKRSSRSVRGSTSNTFSRMSIRRATAVVRNCRTTSRRCSA